MSRQCRITPMRVSAALVLFLALVAQSCASERSNTNEVVSSPGSPLTNWRAAGLSGPVFDELLTCMARFAPDSADGIVQSRVAVGKAFGVCRRVLPLMDQFGSQQHALQTLLENPPAVQSARFFAGHHDSMKSILQQLNGVRRYQRAGAEAAAADILKYLMFQRFGVTVSPDLERMREQSVPLLRQLLVNTTPLALNSRQLSESAENFEEVGLAMHTCMMGLGDASLAELNRDECAVIQDALPIVSEAAGRAIRAPTDPKDKRPRVIGKNAVRILMIYQEAIALTQQMRPDDDLTDYRNDVTGLVDEVNMFFLEDAWGNYNLLLKRGEPAAVAVQTFVESHHIAQRNMELLDQDMAALLAGMTDVRLLSDEEAAQQRAFLVDNQEKLFLRPAEDKTYEHVHTAVCPHCEVGEECTCPVDEAQHMVHLGFDLMATIEGEGGKLDIVPGPRYMPQFEVPGDFRMTTFDTAAVHACVVASIESGVVLEALGGQPLGWVGKCVAGTRETDVVVERGSTTATPLHRRVHPDGNGFQLVVSPRAVKAERKADRMSAVRIAFADNTVMPQPTDVNCYGSYTRVCDYAMRVTSARTLEKFVLKQAWASGVCRKHGLETRGCEVQVYSPVLNGYVPLSDELLERVQDSGIVSVRVVKKKEGMDALVGTERAQTLVTLQEDTDSGTGTDTRMVVRRIPRVPACLDGQVIDIVTETNKMNAAEARRVWYSAGLHMKTLKMRDDAKAAKRMKKKLEKKCSKQHKREKEKKEREEAEAEANASFLCRMGGIFC